MSARLVGRPAPDFSMDAVQAGRPPARVRLEDYRGSWLLMIFYPRDFSFVCPTELIAMSAREDVFKERRCRILGVSVDSIESHADWFATPEDDGGVGRLQFPLASDPEGATSCDYGVWDEEHGVALRGAFLIDPAGVMQYASIHNLNVGRSADEMLRVLEALQTGGLCPASWTSAEGVIDVERALGPGRVLGHYRIEQLLGGGAFGSVFAAWDLNLERRVAIKVLKNDVLHSREALLREARTAAKLNHPHVCTVFAIEEHDGLPLIAMEHLNGRTLSAALVDGEFNPLRVAAQVASGLAEAHRQDVVHGDLKPANIILNERGDATILDFGLARSQHDSELANAERPSPVVGSTVEIAIDAAADGSTIDATIDASVAEAGSLRGTPAYMAPEQTFGSAATPQSDAFSFGLLFYELLTGERAISGDSPLRAVVQLRDEELFAKLSEQVEPDYRDLIGSLLRTAADERPDLESVERELQEREASA